jgi:hypothetical protein
MVWINSPRFMLLILRRAERANARSNSQTRKNQSERPRLGLRLGSLGVGRRQEFHFFTAFRARCIFRKPFWFETGRRPVESRREVTVALRVLPVCNEFVQHVKRVRKYRFGVVRSGDDVLKLVMAKISNEREKHGVQQCARIDLL